MGAVPGELGRTLFLAGCLSCLLDRDERFSEVSAASGWRLDRRIWMAGGITCSYEPARVLEVELSTSLFPQKGARAWPLTALGVFGRRILLLGG